MSREITVSDVQADLNDALSPVRAALEALSNAESCENGADLRANLAEAMDALKVALDEVKALNKAALLAVDA